MFLYHKEAITRLDFEGEKNLKCCFYYCSTSFPGVILPLGGLTSYSPYTLVFIIAHLREPASGTLSFSDHFQESPHINTYHLYFPTPSNRGALSPTSHRVYYLILCLSIVLQSYFHWSRRLLTLPAFMSHEVESKSMQCSKMMLPLLHHTGEVSTPLTPSWTSALILKNKSVLHSSWIIYHANVIIWYYVFWTIFSYSFWHSDNFKYPLYLYYYYYFW